jgi:hypothetical protein
MRVVAMVMVASQHEIKLRDAADPVNSKELIGIIGIRNGKSSHSIKRVSAPHTTDKGLLK